MQRTRYHHAVMSARRRKERSGASGWWKGSPRAVSPTKARSRQDPAPPKHLQAESTTSESPTESDCGISPCPSSQPAPSVTPAWRGHRFVASRRSPWWFCRAHGEVDATKGSMRCASDGAGSCGVLPSAPLHCTQDGAPCHRTKCSCPQAGYETSHFIYTSLGALIPVSEHLHLWRMPKK